MEKMIKLIPVLLLCLSFTISLTAQNKSLEELKEVMKQQNIETDTTFTILSTTSEGELMDLKEELVADNPDFIFTYERNDLGLITSMMIKTGDFSCSSDEMKAAQIMVKDYKIVGCAMTDKM